MANRIRHKELPISIENVRKKILRTVNKVNNATADFLMKHSIKSETRNGLAESVEKVCQKVGTTSTDLLDFDDLEAVVFQVGSKHELPLAAYHQLRRMLDRTKLFDRISYHLSRDLVDVYENHLEKFCISFYQETKRQDLQSVKDYELMIAGFRQEILENFDKVEKGLEEVDEQRQGSVERYIINHDSLIRKMETVCRGMIEICHAVKRWLAADVEYPWNVQEEINIYNRGLMALKELLKEMEAETKNNEAKLRKAAGNLAHVERQIRDVREEIGNYRSRHRNIVENQNDLEEEMKRKREEHKRMEAKLSNRPGMALAVRTQITAQLESVYAEMRGIEDRMQQMDLQMKALNGDEEEAQRQMDKVSVELKKSLRRHETALENLKNHEDAIRAISKDMENHDDKILGLKKVREVKLHSDTLKKIKNHGYDPEHVLEIKDEMQEAFRLTSEDIGKDWTNLYQRLPFDPLRDFCQRQRDLEVIDLSNRRLDADFKQLAMKSLEKWRRLSNLASVEELVNALRKMHRDKTAGKIRRLVLTSPRAAPQPRAD